MDSQPAGGRRGLSEPYLEPLARMSGIDRLLRRASILSGKGERRTDLQNKQLRRLKPIIGEYFDAQLTQHERVRRRILQADAKYLEKKLGFV